MKTEFKIGYKNRYLIKVDLKRVGTNLNTNGGVMENNELLSELEVTEIEERLEPAEVCIIVVI